MRAWMAGRATLSQSSPSPAGSKQKHWGKKGGSVSQSVRPPANATAQARHIAEMAIEQRGSQCQRPPACLTEEDWPGLESVQLVDLAVVGQVGDEVVHVVLPRFVPAGG